MFKNVLFCLLIFSFLVPAPTHKNKHKFIQQCDNLKPEVSKQAQTTYRRGPCILCTKKNARLYNIFKCTKSLEIPDGHRFCADCLKQYSDTKIQEYVESTTARYKTCCPLCRQSLDINKIAKIPLSLALTEKMKSKQKLYLIRINYLQQALMIQNRRSAGLMLKSSISHEASALRFLSKYTNKQLKKYVKNKFAEHQNNLCALFCKLVYADLLDLTCTQDELENLSPQLFCAKFDFSAQETKDFYTLLQTKQAEANAFFNVYIDQKLKIQDIRHAVKDIITKILDNQVKKMSNKFYAYASKSVLYDLLVTEISEKFKDDVVLESLKKLRPRTISKRLKKLQSSLQKHLEVQISQISEFFVNLKEEDQDKKVELIMVDINSFIDQVTQV